jgi:hypothetical protein
VVTRGRADVASMSLLLVSPPHGLLRTCRG